MKCHRVSFSDCIKTKPALLKVARGTEIYDFENKTRIKSKPNVHEVR
jgi:hypothetical protein